MFLSNNSLICFEVLKIFYTHKHKKLCKLKLILMKFIRSKISKNLLIFCFENKIIIFFVLIYRYSCQERLHLSKSKKEVPFLGICRSKLEKGRRVQVKHVTKFSICRGIHVPKCNFVFLINWKRNSKFMLRFYCYHNMKNEIQINAEAIVRRCSVKRCSLKFHKIHRKAAVPEALF